MGKRKPLSAVPRHGRQGVVACHEETVDGRKRRWYIMIRRGRLSGQEEPMYQLVIER